MPTIITFETETLTIVNGQPPILITIEDPPPPLLVTQIPGVGPPGPPGPSDTSALLAHINAAEPHPAYDDQPSLVLIYQNHLL